MIGQQVKITVLKKLDLKDALGVTMPAPPPPPDGGPAPEAPMEPGCPAFREGQEIYYRLGGGVPAGFCDWAWNDIFKDIMAVCSRAAMVPPEQRDRVEPSYTCCTDGLRPVIFKIEAV